MSARSLGYLCIAWSIAGFLGWIPLSPITSLLVTGALLLSYWRAVDREIDAAITRQYTGNTTPGAKP